MASYNDNNNIRRYIPNVVLKNALNDKNLLNVIHVNIKSLVAKIDNLKLYISKTNVHVILVSETWLDEDLTDQMVHIPGYKLYRHDRKKLNDRGNDMRGGGVAVFVKCGLSVKIITKSAETDKIEFLFLELKTNHNTVMLGCVYFPYASVSKFQPLKNALNTFAGSYEHIIIGGDFNVDLLEHNMYLTKSFKNIVSNYDLDFVNKCYPTRIDPVTGRGSLLDIFILPKEKIQNYCKFGQISIPGSSDHDLIYISYKINLNVDPVYFTFRDFKNCDIESLLSETSSLPWSNIFQINHIDDKINYFNELVSYLYEKYVPTKTQRKRDDFVPYFSNNVKLLANQGDAAYNKWKSTKNPDDFNQFKILRNKVNLLIRQAKKSFICSNLNSSLPSKTFWSNANKLGLGSSKKQIENDLDFDVNIVNQKFTSSSIPNSQNNFQFVPNSSNNSFSFRNVSNDEVFSAINKIKSNAIGYDGISTRFLKLILPVILPIITHLFNFILTTGSFPMAWKIAKIIPKQKKSNPTIDDLRPISILSSISKSFELILSEQIYLYLNTFNLLFKYQSGFRKNHSTTSSLLEIVDQICTALDKKHIFILLLLDFSKAFDSINHNILFKKLNTQFNFDISSIKLLQNYLSNRTQFVSISEKISSLLPVICGVPQGSVLGPLLFSLFINDLFRCLSHCHCRLYAEDSQIFKSGPISQLVTLINKVNLDLKSIENWSNINCLKLNPLKSQAMIIYKRAISIDNLPKIKLGNSIIEYTDKAKNLGIMFSSPFLWHDHISLIATKIYPILRRLWKFSYFLDFWTKKKLIVSLVLPHFLYSCVVFAGLREGEFHRLNVMFNDCTRFVANRKRCDHISDLSKTLLDCTFSNFLDFKVVTNFKKILNGFLPNYLFEKITFGRSTRNKNVIVPKHFDKTRELSFFVHGSKLWNALPNAIKNESSNNKFLNLTWNHFKNLS